MGLLARALLECFPLVRGSAEWLCTWFRETMAWLGAKREEVRAIDDTLEQTSARMRELRPKLMLALANDQPSVRCQILAVWDAEIAAAEATHQATEQTARALVPACPEALLR